MIERPERYGLSATHTVFSDSEGALVRHTQYCPTCVTVRAATFTLPLLALSWVAGIFETTEPLWLPLDCLAAGVWVGTFVRAIRRDRRSGRQIIVAQRQE